MKTTEKTMDTDDSDLKESDQPRRRTLTQEGSQKSKPVSMKRLSFPFRKVSEAVVHSPPKAASENTELSQPGACMRMGKLYNRFIPICFF